MIFILKKESCFWPRTGPALLGHRDTGGPCTPRRSSLCPAPATGTGGRGPGSAAGDTTWAESAIYEIYI